MADMKTLSDVYKKALTLYVDDSTKIVIMSDCHRGDGSGSDQFTQNQNIYIVGLNYYFRHGYTYIELGDGDELWENKDFQYITCRHYTVFEILSRFYNDGRLYMIYGNHDMVKKNKNWVRNNLDNYFSECGKIKIPLFKDIDLHEGIVLKNLESKENILLLHGHQVDFLNNNLWIISRFLVRYLWRPLEIIGVNNPLSPLNNHEKEDIIESRLGKWAKKENIILIAGHTHRPVLPEVGESLYFNDGSCVNPNYITAIEIENGRIALVKWSIKAKDDGVLYIGRDVIKGPREIKDYYCIAADKADGI